MSSNPNTYELAARRDASVYRSIGHASVQHIVAAGYTSACGRSILLVEDAVPAAEVPQESRCQRYGCKQRWP